MDINQFDWVIVRGKPNFWRGTLRRSVLLFPLFVGATFLIVSFAYSGQRIFKKEELLFVLEALLLITVAVINGIWHMVVQATPDRLIPYKVSSEGISIGKKKIGLKVLKDPRVETTLAQAALPYQQWRTPKSPGVLLLELTLITNQGKIVMKFPGEYERQKFIRTLQEYLHPTPIVETSNAPSITN